MPGGGSTIDEGDAAASSVSDSELEEYEFSCVFLISFDGKNDHRGSSDVNGKRD